MDKLRIVSYNCRGIKSSLPVIHEVCTDNDIVLLQETLPCSHNLHFINSIHSDFYAGGCISVDSSERVIMGRPYGGWALYYVAKTTWPLCHLETIHRENHRH